MKFWDSSGVVPLLVVEPTTAALKKILAQDSVMLVWWTTKVECASAVARRERERALASDAVSDALAALEDMSARWLVVDPVDAVQDAAIRFLRVHDLSAGDALQLAAAYIGSERRPAGLEFVCRDERLARAAEREGFVVR